MNATTKLTDAQISQLNKAIGDGINALDYMSISMRRATVPYVQKRIRTLVEEGHVTFSEALQRIKELVADKPKETNERITSNEPRP